MSARQHDDGRAPDNPTVEEPVTTDPDSTAADPVEPDHVEPDPVEPDPTAADPVDPDPTAADPVDPDPTAAGPEPSSARRGLRLRITLVAVTPSLVLLPVLLARTPNLPPLEAAPDPPTVTWTPPPVPESGPSPEPVPDPAQATELSRQAREAFPYQMSTAHLLALAALEDAVTPQTLVTAGTVLSPAWPTARALHVDGPPVRAVAFSPDGSLLVTGHRGGVARLWDVRGGRPIGTLAGAGAGAGAGTGAGGGDVEQLAFSPDGRTLAIAAGDRQVRLWQVRTRRQVGALTDPSGATLHRVTFSHDGQHVATSGPAGVRIWTIRDRRVRASISLAGPRPSEDADLPGAPPLPAWLPPVGFTADGRTLVVGTGDGSVALVDPATGSRRTTLPTANSTGQDDPVTALAFSADGRSVASGHGSGAVDLWDPVPWTTTARLNDDPESADLVPVRALSFSPDARRLAMSLLQDPADDTRPPYGQVTVFDLPVRGGYGVGARLAGAVHDVAFAPDGRHLATADVDDLARLWSWDSGSGFRAPVRDWPATLCRRAGANLDAATWRKAFGDAPYRRLCADFPGPQEVPGPRQDAGWAPARPLPQLG